MFDRVHDIVRLLGVLLLSGIAILSAAQIILRYFFDASIIWSNDLNKIMMMWMVMIGVGGMLWKGSHFTLTIVIENLPNNVSKFLRIVVNLVIAVFAIFLIVTGTQLAIGQSNQVVPALGVSYMYVYLAMPVGAFFMLVFSVGLAMKEFNK